MPDEYDDLGMDDWANMSYDIQQMLQAMLDKESVALGLPNAKLFPDRHDRALSSLLQMERYAAIKVIVSRRHPYRAIPWLTASSLTEAGLYSQRTHAEYQFSLQRISGHELTFPCFLRRIRTLG